MKTKKIITGILFFSFSLNFIACNSGKPKSVTISGAFALYPLGVKWTEEYKKLQPEARFDVSAGGAGKGLTDVLAGAADLAMFSRALTPVEAQKDIVLFAVAKDAVLPTFSAKNPLAALIHRKGLTHDQLKEIYFSGKDITWGSQIRSYVLDMSRIKDLRTGVEVGNTQAVLDGDLDKFIEASLISGL